MKLEYYQYDDEKLTELANQVKGIFLDSMLKESQITEEEHVKMSSYAVVICKRNYFGEIWNKLFSKEKTSRIVIVKIIDK